MEILQAIRDVAIIVLAMVTLGVGIAVLLLVWQLWRLATLARAHMEHLGGSAHEILGTLREAVEITAQTARHAQGTAEFVAERTASPVIDFYSAISGASRFARTLFRTDRDGKNGGTR